MPFPDPSTLGIFALAALALGLGVTPADGDHLLRVGELQHLGVPEVRGEALIGLLADRAGVEDDHVRVRLRDRLPQSELLEHALDPLRVVGVHLAAERGDVVAAHEQKPSRAPLGLLLGQSAVRLR